MASAGQKAGLRLKFVETVALTTTAAPLATALTAGKIYIVYSDVIWRYVLGTFGAVTALTTSPKLAAYQTMTLEGGTSEAGYVLTGVSGILDGGTGSLYVFEVQL